METKDVKSPNENEGVEDEEEPREKFVKEGDVNLNWKEVSSLNENANGSDGSKVWDEGVPKFEGEENNIPNNVGQTVEDLNSEDLKEGGVFDVHEDPKREEHMGWFRKKKTKLG